MNKSEIVTAFERLNAELSTKGIRGEIGVVGGAAMVLGFNARSATKDVDAIFVPSENIREAAKKVAHELSLPDDWINDAVKGFLPGEPKEKRVLFGGDSLTSRALKPRLKDLSGEEWVQADLDREWEHYIMNERKD